MRGADFSGDRYQASRGISADDVRAQLARILASPDFDASERNRRFLSHIVEETLAGRGDRIKAYGIAVAAFDRDDSFDPQSDPIVRIEASRLRRSLERYYLLAGKDDPLRIEIPKGGYVAAFHRRENADKLPFPESSTLPLERPAVPPTPSSPRRLRLKQPRVRVLLIGVALLGTTALGWLASAPGGLWPGPSAPVTEDAMVGTLRQGPAILVAPFEDDGAQSAHPGLSHGFTREVIAGLTRFSDLFVFGPDTTFRHGEAADARRSAAELALDFILAGGVTASADRFRVTASLIDVKSGRYLRSGRFDGKLAATEVIQVRDDLADQVVRELAQPYGVIFREKAIEIQGKLPQNFTSYECVLHFHHYWRTYDPELYGSVRECLERAIVVDPDYADAFSRLAIIYADAYRFNLDQGAISVDPLPRALELAHRAADLAPHSTHSHHALHLVYWLMNDVERSIEAAERGLRLNPNDSELMAELGLRYCLRAQWDKGLPLVRQAYARNPAQPGQYRIALFLHHYINRRYEEALAEAKKIETRSIIYGHAALAMAYGQLGRTEEAAGAVADMLAIDPAYGEHAIADLAKRNLHSDLISAVVDGFRKAGLPIEGSPMRKGS
jgi:adenylate cyclase